MTTTITALPPAPSDRTDPAVYNSTANTWAAALPTWTTQVNTVGDEITTIGNNATTSASTATTQAGIATTKAAEAAVSAVQAAASASATAVLWVSGTNYTAGTLQYSPINGATYRRFIGGATTLDPSLDYTNYRPITRKEGVGTIQMLSPLYSTNEVVFPNGTKFLKTGVVVSKTDALTANYDVNTLEQVNFGSVLPIAGVAVTSTQSIAYGAGKYVVVGNTGQIKYSSNGTSWTTATSGTATDLNKVVFVNNTFVAMGANIILSSTDGITWTTKTHPTGSSSIDMFYLNGRYIFTGSGASTWNSTDLTTWKQSSNSVSSAALGGSNKAIVYAGGSGHVAIVDLTTGLYSAVYSNTGTTGYGVDYTNGNYIAMYTGGTANGAYSTNGTNWTTMSSVPAVVAGKNYQQPLCAFGAGIYVFAGQATSTVLSSTDLSTWTVRATNSTSNFSAVKYLNGVFFNYYGVPHGGGPATISTSTDGINWTQRTVTQGVAAMAYGASVYVTVGGNNSSLMTINSSTDGFTWTNRENVGGGIGYVDVIYAAGKFVAVGDAGIIKTSTDGITWTTRTGTLGSVVLSKIEYVNSKFIITSVSGIMQSSDGITWTSITQSGSQATTTNPTWDFVAYTGSRYVFLAKNSQSGYGFSTDLSTYKYYVSISASMSLGYTASSGTRLITSYSGVTSLNSFHQTTDGVIWSAIDRPTTSWTNSEVAITMGYFNGTFVALKDTQIWYSSTGLDWSAAPVTTTAGTGQAVSHNGSTWFVTGATANATSTNLTTWTTRSKGPSSYNIGMLTYGGGNYVGVVTLSSNIIVTPDGYTGAIGAGSSVSITNASTYLQVT